MIATKDWPEGEIKFWWDGDRYTGGYKNRDGQIYVIASVGPHAVKCEGILTKKLRDHMERTNKDD